MHCDLEYIVCCGVPPTIVDSPEWKELISVLNSNYQSPSSMKLTGNLIIKEAAKISEGIKEYLGKVRHLMITFDGGKIRRPNSLYTIHITVPGGRTFCMELNDGARKKHTAEYILGVLDRLRGKRSGENLPAASRKPPPPKPRTLASLSNSDSEDEFDDGADWLDGDHSQWRKTCLCLLDPVVLIYIHLFYVNNSIPALDGLRSLLLHPSRRLQSKLVP